MRRDDQESSICLQPCGPDHIIYAHRGSATGSRDVSQRASDQVDHVTEGVYLACDPISFLH